LDYDAGINPHKLVSSVLVLLVEARCLIPLRNL